MAIWIVIAIACIFSAFTIHPSGGIYAALLLLADRVHESVFKTKDVRVLIRWSIVIGLGWMIVNGILNNVENGPLTAEYGWQGGIQLIQWNMPLLLVALWGLKRGHRTLEVRTLATWFILLWLSSLIHLFIGLEGSTFLTITSLSLYSICLLYTSPSPRDLSTSRMPSSA